MVEQAAVNRKVAGSSPASGAIVFEYVGLRFWVGEVGAVNVKR